MYWTALYFHLTVIIFFNNGLVNLAIDGRNCWPHREKSTNGLHHYRDVIVRAIASQVTGVSMVCSTVYSGAVQRKLKSSASLAFVRGIHRWPVDSPHKGPVTRKMFAFDEVIMRCCVVFWFSISQFYPYLSGLLNWQNVIIRLPSDSEGTIYNMGK